MRRLYEVGVQKVISTGKIYVMAEDEKQAYQIANKEYWNSDNVDVDPCGEAYGWMTSGIDAVWISDEEQHDQCINSEE